MAVKVKIFDDVAVLKLRGKLMGGDETEEVGEKVKNIITNGITKILLDVSRVQWINSSGVGMLMACYSSVYNVNGKIGLIKVPEKVKKVMMITQMNKLFDEFVSIRQALTGYK